MLWFIALKARIFPEFAAFRKIHVLLIRQFFVVALALDSRTESLNLARCFVGNDVILHGVALLLARVIRLLSLLVLRTTNGSLGAINDEFESRTRLQNRFDVFGGACW